MLRVAANGVFAILALLRYRVDDLLCSYRHVHRGVGAVRSNATRIIQEIVLGTLRQLSTYTDDQTFTLSSIIPDASRLELDAERPYT